MPKIKETKLTKDYLKWLNNLPKTYAEKRYAGPGRKGRVDITGCSHGFRCEIEVKIGDNKPTDLQNWWIKKWLSCAAVSFWGNTLQGLKDTFRKQMAEKGVVIK
jgi:hypothetical protein